MHFYPLPQLSRKRIHDIQPIKRERNSTLEHLFYSLVSPPISTTPREGGKDSILSQKLIRNSLKILKYRNISFFNLFYKLTFRIISYIHISCNYIILHNDRCFFNEDLRFKNSSSNLVHFILERIRSKPYIYFSSKTKKCSLSSSCFHGRKRSRFSGRYLNSPFLPLRATFLGDHWLRNFITVIIDHRHAPCVYNRHAARARLNLIPRVPIVRHRFFPRQIRFADLPEIIPPILLPALRNNSDTIRSSLFRVDVEKERKGEEKNVPVLLFDSIRGNFSPLRYKTLKFTKWSVRRFVNSFLNLYFLNICAIVYREESK